VGQGRGAAEQALDDAGFEVRVEEEESSFEEQGLVTNQNPAGGSTEEVGSDVTITVGAGPSTVEVPDLRGNNPDQAAVLLEQAGLELGAQNEIYDDDPATEGTVISQDPQPSSEAEPGTSVDITVSLGLEPVIVPQVYGMDLATARQTVANAGFYYDDFKVEPTGDEPAGTALYTDPEAGTELDPGSTVVIYYSSGPPEPPPERNTAEPDEDDAEARAEARAEEQQRREDAREARQDNRGTGNGGDGGGNGAGGSSDSGNGNGGNGDGGNGNNE
jgi:serine/threonine-protein kinase